MEGDETGGTVTWNTLGMVVDQLVTERDEAGHDRYSTTRVTVTRRSKG